MQNKSLIPNDLLHDEEQTNDPYQVIANSFDAYGLTGHRRYLSTWMESVNKNDYWRENWPSDLIGYYTRLTNLVQAVYRIYKEPRMRKTAMDLLNEKGYPVETNLLHPALYVGWVPEHTLWNYFPRSLCLEEYIDPYLVFNRFFSLYSLDQWLGELYELLSDGLSGHDPAYFYGQDRNMLLIGKSLLKLVEAAHLIDVREVEYIGDFKKINIYTLDRPCEEISMIPLLSVKPQEKNKSAFLPDRENDEANKKDKETAKMYSDKAAREELPPDRQNARSIELTIQGNCLVNDQPMPLEPIKIKMTVKMAGTV